jgi:uncharacterized membrane protein YeaQ/YmgE (transglycosylase-associated protein family)
VLVRIRIGILVAFVAHFLLRAARRRDKRLVIIKLVSFVRGVVPSTLIVAIIIFFLAARMRRPRAGWCC